MVLFNKLQNNFLINRFNRYISIRYISIRYLVTKRIIFLFLFILFFLLQGFGTSNVLAEGLRNEQIDLHHPNPTINREYFENEIGTTWQLIDEARDELKRLEQTRNSQIIDRFGDYDNELKKEFGSQNNYYLGTLKLLETNYLTLLDLHRNYSVKKEMIEEKISNNERRKGIKEKGFTAIKQLIKRNSKEYDKAQSDSEQKALVEKEESLLKIKKELEETSYQDAVYLKNENNKQGGSEYNVVNTNPESIYEDNVSDHSSIVKILKKIDISPQDLRYDDNTKETLYINLKEVNQKLEDLAQDISNIEQQESILNQEKDHYDKLSSAINIKEDKIRKLEETKQYFESKLDCKEANNSLPTLPKKKFKNVAACIISIIKAQPQASNSLMSVKSPYIPMSIVAESQSLAKTTPPVTIVNSEEFDSRNDGAKPIDNRRVIEDDVTKFSSIDYNLQHSVETIYLNDLENGDNKQGVSKNNLELHEDENPPKPYKTKRQKRSIAVHDNADVIQNEIFDKDNLGLEELFKEEAVPIVANEQLPEEEHHADKHLVVNVQPLEAVPQPSANVVHVENHPTAVQPPVANEQHLIPNDQPQKDEHEIFDEDNLGLEKLFKEEDVPIVTNDQAQEAEHDADKPLVANDQPQKDEHLIANEQLPEPEHPADKRLVANDQPQKDEHLIANEQLPEPEHPADEQLISDVQPIATAAEPQISAETTILAEKESYISPINFDIEQNIAKYTTYIEFDFLDLTSNALSTRNNLLKHNTVNMVAAGDNDYYIKKGGWIQVMNSTSKQKGNTLPFKNNQQGFVLGFDAQPLDELIIGIAYANANSYTKFQGIFNDKQNIILHVAAVYSKYTLSQNMYLSSYLKYGKAFIKNLGKRDTISIKSKTNGYVGRAKLETHYKVDLDKFLFKPMVGIIFDRFLIKNFTEYRKDFNINVPTRKGKRVSFETGIDFSKRILVRNISIIPKVYFKLEQTVLLNNSTDIINFTSIEHHTQTAAITKSLRPSPKNVMYTLGGCINMQSVSELELGAGYDYSLKKSFTTHSFYVNGSVKF
ncbi:autotransporter domain-containing protein [Candidatus Tisiphia endosymbiont of Neophilaenus lineatus]|uniref:autotransporter domain-containing protein n=1 Tax=Candidatus Tisiphia endosymbiont of Neophilaenus lineatus TaxID=3139336 RepID=UPI0035CC49FE